jgi:hypothetical protein
MRKVMKYSLVIFIICFCSIRSLCISPEEYEKALKQAINFLIQGKTLNADMILKAIPQSDEDFSIFYSISDKDEKSKIAFYELNNLIREHAKNKEKNIFKAYLLLSEFVDGEYAEGYFDHAEALIKNNRNIFCDFYLKSPTNKVKRLHKYYTKYCK